MTKPLSSAAAAVFDALNEQFHELNSQHMAAAVAALRAVADQVVPVEPYYENCDEVREEILAIADELEAS